MKDLDVLIMRLRNPALTGDKVIGLNRTVAETDMREAANAILALRAELERLEADHLESMAKIGD